MVALEPASAPKLRKHLETHGPFRDVRIVSLLPSATEILYAIGLGEEVVGVSPECDYPPAAKSKTVVSRNVIDPQTMSQGAIDAAVLAHLREGGGLYHVDVETLQTLLPDLMFTQNLCNVCAASMEDVKGAASRLSKRPDIVSLDPTDLDEVLHSIERVGQETGRESEAGALVDGLRTRLRAVTERTRDITDRPAVACIEWFDPLFNAGHWVPQMVEIAGGEELLADRGKPSRRIAWEDVVQAAPDVIVLMPCGFGVNRAMKDARLVTGLPGWQDLPAVQSGRVFAVDGSSFFSRPGPRLVEGVELLAHLLHPERFRRKWPKQAMQRVVV